MLRRVRACGFCLHGPTALDKLSLLQHIYPLFIISNIPELLSNPVKIFEIQFGSVSFEGKIYLEWICVTKAQQSGTRVQQEIFLNTKCLFNQRLVLRLVLVVVVFFKPCINMEPLQEPGSSNYPSLITAAPLKGRNMFNRGTSTVIDIHNTSPARPLQIEYPAVLKKTMCF